MSVQTPEYSARTAPNMVRWGSVFSGAIIALAAFVLVGSMWFGFAYTGNATTGFIGRNLAWFLAGTAIGALFIGGLLAGLLSGVRGAMAGLANGVTAWGLLVVGSLLTVIPTMTALASGLGSSVASAAGAPITAETATWAAFWSLLIGLGTAGIGGLIGGLVKRTVKVADLRERETAPATRRQPVYEDVERPVAPGTREYRR